MEVKYLDIHIIYSDKDKKYLSTVLKGYKNFKIKNSVNNWKISLNVHNNSGVNNIGQFQRYEDYAIIFLEKNVYRMVIF